MTMIVVYKLAQQWKTCRGDVWYPARLRFARAKIGAETEALLERVLAELRNTPEAPGRFSPATSLATSVKGKA